MAQLQSEYADLDLMKTMIPCLCSSDTHFGRLLPKSMSCRLREDLTRRKVGTKEILCAHACKARAR